MCAWRSALCCHRAPRTVDDNGLQGGGDSGVSGSTGGELDSGTRLVRIWSQRSLARLERDGSIHIGTSKTPDWGNDFGYFGFESESFWETTDHVLLTVSLKCSVAWLPYTIGQPVPLRAAVCGTWNGKPVYTLRGTTSSGEYKFAMYISGHPVVPSAVSSGASILILV